jgi:asparagine synthase (glutamine-hydrolysing)
MPQRTLAAIHDPRHALAPHAVRARLAAALGPGASVRLAGALAVGWTGGERACRAGVRAVVDGDMEAPDGWAASWPAALAGLRALRGGFALVAWDETAERGLVARDHLGARPMFGAVAGGALHVASELGPLLATLPRRPGPDHDELARRLVGRRGASGETLYAGVRELLPAHALLLDAGGWRLERYWRPHARPGLDDADRATAADALRGGVRAAVRRHAAPGDAVLASGGLDSSVVLACAAAESPRPTAFTGVPERVELDESAHLTALAADVAADVVRVRVPAGPITGHAEAHLERWGVPLELPGAAFFLPVQVAAAARGVASLLDGEGGDELFGCEPLLIADRLRAGDGPGALALTRALPGLERLDARSLRVITRRWLAPGLLSPSVLGRLRAVAAARRPVPEWLGAQARAAAREPGGEAWRRRGEPRWRAHLAWLLTDARAELGAHDHLRRVSALAGIGDVHPFLDVDLIELVLGLPPELAFDPRLDRPLLREAMRGLLPERVRLRADKVFFTVLLRDALTGTDRGAVGRTLTGAPLELGALVDARRLAALWAAGPDACARGPWAWSAEIWRVFALERWLRREATRRE